MTAAGPAGLQRHDWVRLDPMAMQASVPADDDLMAWLSADGRAVVRRPDPPVPPGQVALGVVLAVAGERRRVAFAAPSVAIAAVEPPPELSHALEAAPPGWRPGLAALDRQLRQLGLLPRAYGSLAWQHVSGQPHLRPGSDVDLLLRPRDHAQITAALAMLGEREGQLPRLDGEVVFPGGGAVAWRELAAAPDRVLVKSLTRLELCPPAELLALLRRAA